MAKCNMSIHDEFPQAVYNPAVLERKPNQPAKGFGRNAPSVVTADHVPVSDAMTRKRLLFPAVGLLLFGASSKAENVEQAYQLRDITVHSTRIETGLLDTPAAVSLVERTDIQLARQQLGLDEAIARIPGVFSMNRYNMAQDLRISIRGFGARAPFGIRGIKIMVDGIPSTLPDGSTPSVLDIDLGSAQRIEVLRGPSSALYGSASGGVINVYTEDGPDTPFIEGRLSLGSYAFQREQLKAGGQADDLNYLVSLSHMQQDGYRDHNESEKSLFNSKMHLDLTPGSTLSLVVSAIDAPTNNDPGGLTLMQMETDPTAARDRNILFDAGESFDQQKIGLIYHRELGESGLLRLRNYYVWRDFKGRLPFEGSIVEGNGGQIRLDRFFWGGGVDYTHDGNLFSRPNKLIAGIDLDRQSDDRKRYLNNRGMKGSLTLDQDETVSNYGIFFQDDWKLTDELNLVAGVRYDNIRIDIDDRFFDNAGGDESGSRTFSEWSPRIGLSWSAGEVLNLYGNFSTSFETPGTTDFANPTGGGLNPDLKAQTARNYEIGVKGSVAGQLSYEAVLFHIRVEDELIPYELPDQPGRKFFENAGISVHDGLEASFTYRPEMLPGLKFHAAYTYSDFTFDRFETRSGRNYDGNVIPGIPDHQLYAEISYHHSTGFFAILDLQYVGRMFADNANSVEVDPYQVTNARFGYLSEIDNWDITPFIGINNMFDESYSSNIRVNAFGGRYYEPAPERNIFGGLTIRYNFY